MTESEERAAQPPEAIHLDPSNGFDECASHYDDQLAQGIAISGEDKRFFIHGRLKWLAGCLQHHPLAITSIVDFGCGIGDTAAELSAVFPGSTVIGVDVSQKSLQAARARYGCESIRFQHTTDLLPPGSADLLYCNGVFHHVAPLLRLAIARNALQVLRPGGVFALWENNPWSLAARYVMSRIPFDRDAVMVWPAQARRLCRNAGMTVTRTDFQFIFPHCMRPLRILERLLCKMPLGAQYQVFSVKPT